MTGFFQLVPDVTVSFVAYTSVTTVHVIKDTVTSAQAGRNLSKTQIFIILISSNLDASFNYVPPTMLHPKLSFCDLFLKSTTK